MYNPSKYKPPPPKKKKKTRNAKNPPLNHPSKCKPPGGLYLEIALKYKVKQSKNGKFPSTYKASPIDLKTQIFLRILAPPNINPSKRAFEKYKPRGLFFSEFCGNLLEAMISPCTGLYRQAANFKAFLRSCALHFVSKIYSERIKTEVHRLLQFFQQNSLFPYQLCFINLRLFFRHVRVY